MRVYMLVRFNLETAKIETELYQTKKSAIKRMKEFGKLTRLPTASDEAYQTIRNGKCRLWGLLYTEVKK